EHTLAINSHENDSACIKDVTSKLDKYKYRIISNKNYNCYELKCIYSMCDYVVGTRFHSVIFSLSNGVPGIAITYAGNKGQGIMHDIGLDEFTVAIKDVRYSILREKFERLISNEEVIRSKVSNYLKLAKMQRDKLIEKIKLALG
ncbi:polysaccharide pyruvyl transferase family protein, partial [Bacillaceae bacterium Marseille-Q3522]|nr:polysaccharide pyruvyl transferase family protein [Bacillaceae bacterium Marseille-Q3522]